TGTVLAFPSPGVFRGGGGHQAGVTEASRPPHQGGGGSGVDIHPETAAGLGVAMGDGVKVETEAGSVVLPAYLYPGIRKDTVAIPLGQGHTAYGRYAKDRGV